MAFEQLEKKLKRLFIIVLCIVICLFFAGCKKDRTSSENSGSDEGTAYEKSVVIDLSQETQTMAYSRLFALMSEPESYDGCTLKLEGKFLPFEERGKQFYACVVTDEAGCCAQAIEFIPEKGLKFPEDFPKEEADIIIKGTIEVYDADGEKGCRLSDTAISVVRGDESR